MTAKAWLHIGLHKTGTTTLQHDFFPRLQGVAYIGKGTILPPPVKDDMRRMIIALKGAGDRADVVEGMIPYFRSRAAAWNLHEFPLLLSEEGFSFTWPGSRFDRLAVLPAVLRRIVGAETRIVMVVREPLALLRSLYEELMLRVETDDLRALHGDECPPGFFRWLEVQRARHAAGAVDTVFGGILRFDRIRASFADAFGAERVHLLPYEPMIDEPDRYCRAWCRLLGIAEQVRPLPRQNVSGRERRDQVLRRFAIGPDDPRAHAFHAQFADLPERLREDGALAAFVERHCAPVRAAAAADYMRLTAGTEALSSPTGARPT